MSVSPETVLETILVVDDTPAVLEVISAILKRAHFRVLVADSGAAALKLAEETTERIHLLLSDVEMPELSGPDLGEALKRKFPNLRVMLMSGGPNGNLLVLNYGWAYIQKPFVAQRLVETIRSVLGAEHRPQITGQDFETRRLTE